MLQLREKRPIFNIICIMRKYVFCGAAYMILTPPFFSAGRRKCTGPPHTSREKILG